MDPEEVLLTGVMRCLADGQPSNAQGEQPDALQEVLPVRQFRQAAQVLIDHYLDGPNRAPAKRAYDTGIVGGFYGLDALSAEVTGMEGSEPPDQKLARPRRRMFWLGYAQGRAMRKVLRKSGVRS